MVAGVRLPNSERDLQQHMGVHPTAVVAETTVIGEGVEIGPYCVIGPNVVLGAGCKLQSHVIIDGDTYLGENNVVYPHAVIGTMPQDKKIDAPPLRSTLRIGDNNQIREFCTIHGGTEFGSGITKVGSHNMLLVGCHVGHDSSVGDHVVFTNGSMAAGHTVIQDHAILGAMVGVHQFARVGCHVMVGAGAMVSKDSPPYALVQGDRARLVGINIIGLKRHKFENAQIARIKKAFRELFWSDGTFEERLARAEPMAVDDECVRRILEFTRESKRGLVMPTEGDSVEGSTTE